MDVDKPDGHEPAKFSMEFVIPGNNADLLKKNGARVKRLFNVDVEFANTFQRGNVTMQWINFLSGASTAEQMNNAKTYILSMTNPDTIINLKDFPSSLYMASVDEVEAETCAFLTQKKTNIAIQGSQLAVVLAQSMLESVQQESTPRSHPGHEDANFRHRGILEEKQKTFSSSNKIRTEGDNSSQQIIPSQQSLNNRSHSAQSSSSSSSPSQGRSSSIQPSKCASASTDKEVFPIGKTSKTNIGDKPSTSSSSSRKSNNNKNNMAVKSGCGDTAVESGCGDTAAGEVSSDVGIVNQYRYLQTLGLEHGYDPGLIEEGLGRCDITDVVQPAEFLNILKFIAESERGTSSSSSVSSGNCKSTTKSSQKPSAATAKTALTNSQTSSSAAGDNSVILINSDSEIDAESGAEACVISSEEDEPIFLSATKQGRQKTTVNRNNQRPNPQQVAIGGLDPIRNGPETCFPHEPRVPLESRVQPGPRPRVDARRKFVLRHIVIDGNNVAMHHGDHKVYSVKGIQICINYFLARGHKVTAFVSGSRRYYQPRKTFPMKDKKLLDKLESEGSLKFTPSRRLSTGRIISSYDDRFVLNLADAENGIVVSNDQYRDLLYEKPSYKEIIENRLLPFMFVGDLFMPPDDPLGRDGPTLDQFLGMDGPSPPEPISSGGAMAARIPDPVPACQREPFSTPGPEPQLQPPPAKKRKVLQSSPNVHVEGTQVQSSTKPPQATTVSSSLNADKKTESEKKDTEQPNKGMAITHLRVLYPDLKFAFFKDPDCARRFISIVTVNNQTFQASGASKKVARREAAELALHHVLGAPTVAVESPGKQSVVDCTAEYRKTRSTSNLAPEKKENKSSTNLAKGKRKVSPTNLTSEKKEKTSTTNITVEKKEKSPTTHLTVKKKGKTSTNLTVEKRETGPSTKKKEKASSVYLTVEKKEKASTTNLTVEKKEKTSTSNLTVEKKEKTSTTNLTIEKKEKTSTTNLTVEKREKSSKVDKIVDPVTRFMKLQPNATFSLVNTSGKDHARVFTMAVTVNNQVFAAKERTKKKAKLAAVNLALDHFLGMAEMRNRKTNPILRLRELNPVMKFTNFKKTGLSYAPIHSAWLEMDWKKIRGKGTTRKLAMCHAARKAIKLIQDKQARQAKQAKMKVTKKKTRKKTQRQGDIPVVD